MSDSKQRVVHGLVSERPLELFIGFDRKPSEIHSSDIGSVCAAITGMDMEVYYDLTED